MGGIYGDLTQVIPYAYSKMRAVQKHHVAETTRGFRSDRSPFLQIKIFSLVIRSTTFVVCMRQRSFMGSVRTQSSN